MRRPLQFCRVILPLNFVCSHHESSLLFLLLFKMLLLCFLEENSLGVDFVHLQSHQPTNVSSRQLASCSNCQFATNHPSSFALTPTFNIYQRIPTMPSIISQSPNDIAFSKFSKYLHHSEVMKEFSTA